MKRNGKPWIASWLLAGVGLCWISSAEVSAQPAQVRVRAPSSPDTPVPRPPPMPQVITRSPQCAASIVNLDKQQRCVACIRRGGQFYPQGEGIGACSVVAPPAAPPPAPPQPATPPPPPPVTDEIRVVGECNLRIAFVPKRERCFACVRRGGIFRHQGPGPGFCTMVAPPPPPPPPAVPMPPPGEIRTVDQCNMQVMHGGKRHRCVACITRGGVFNKQGAGPGFCTMPPPLPTEAIRTVNDCQQLVSHLPKRQRCISCVSHGGVFYKHGAASGHCSNAPGTSVTTPGTSVTVSGSVSVSTPGTSVTTSSAGTSVTTPGTSVTTSSPPPASPTIGISVEADCHSIPAPPKRAMCIDCIRHGGLFYRHRWICRSRGH